MPAPGLANGASVGLPSQHSFQGQQAQRQPGLPGQNLPGQQGLAGQPGLQHQPSSPGAPGQHAAPGLPSAMSAPDSRVRGSHAQSSSPDRDLSPAGQPVYPAPPSNSYPGSAPPGPAGPPAPSRPTLLGQAPATPPGQGGATGPLTPGAPRSYPPGPFGVPASGSPSLPPAPVPPSAPPGQMMHGQMMPGQFPAGPGPQDQEGPAQQAYVPAQGPYGGPQQASQHAAAANPPSQGIPLADATAAAHAEGFEFGQSVAREAPALWLEAVLARKPRMPSDLEARLLQDSALPIDSLLHDETRHALRRGFWDALERSRR